MTTAPVRPPSSLDRFVGTTLKSALILFGFATCLPILLTIDPTLGNQTLFGGGLDIAPSVEIIVRHWGFMVFGIGVQMIAAAFLPWLRFPTLIFALTEKILLVGMVVANLGQPWGRDYLTAGILDGIISIYIILYFLSSHGRPSRWVPAPPH